MVQFIPSAPGTTPWAPQRPGLLEQLGPLLSGAGQFMGAPDANGQQGGIASILSALHGRQTLDQFMGIPNAPTAPIIGPAGYVPPGAGPSAVPAGSRPPAPKSPFGAMGQMPVNRLRQMSDTFGKTGISGILGNMNAMTLYMSPDGSLSMTPIPGAMPIGGFKGPQAASAVQGGERLKIARSHQSRLDKLSSSQLTPEQKIKLALVNAQSRILGNPMIEMSPEETKSMTDHVNTVLSELEKAAGVDTSVDAPPDVSAPAPKATKPVTAKTPEEYLKKNHPGFPLTPKNIKWAKEKMSGK